ncbi:MAG: hypothetical protein ABJG88_00510 [Litorimonas sp.]
MKSRYIWMALGGLFIAFILFFLIQIAGVMRSGQLLGVGGRPQNDNAEQQVDRIAMQPVSFENISEFLSGDNRKMRLSGRAEPDSVIVLLNRGERMRQIKTNAEGAWGVTLDIDGQAMAIEALMFTGQDQVSIRSDETIFRIPTPRDETIASANYITPALIIICNSGGPSRVIQSPFGQSPTQGPLGFNAIDYDDAGGVILSGTTSVNGRVRLYLGEQVIGETGVRADGRWTFTAGKILPLGEYNVWAELNPVNGQSVRIGVVFERLPPLPQTVGDDGSISVSFEPLRWQIRRSLLGGGSQSTVIFAPNGQVAPITTPQEEQEPIP